MLLLLFVLLFDSLCLCHPKSLSMSVSLALSRLPHKPVFMPFLSPSIAPTHSPVPAYRGTVAGPSIHTSPRHHRPHKNAANSPMASIKPGCDQNCLEPLTSTPIGSPCGCVFPMKVKLLLDVAPYTIFPIVSELEIEIAACIYLKQSQVRIMGASADSQSQGRTVIEINLVPLGEKFDNTTATLMYERFLQKKVHLNMTLFGNYEVIGINYEGFPFSSPFGSFTGHNPTGSPKSLPVTANFGTNTKNTSMNLRLIALIALSAFAPLLVCVGSVSILIKWRKARRPSSTIGVVMTSSMNKRSGNGSTISSSIPSLTSMSLASAMTPCVLSVKTYALAEIERATERFSQRKIIGEGGFGRVYCGLLDDGSEVAVKLLTRDYQNRDREFIAEVEMLSRLHHRNLVKLLGVCIEGRKCCLIYELVHNGSVESHLHGVDKRKEPLDWDARVKIALGAARGLAYLHEDSNPHVIHRDFKGSNVLLEDDFTPKVSDFGLAREATEGSQLISTRVMGTFGYVAPEYAMTGHLLVKSDVYSYGVVLLELLSGRKPVDMNQPPGQENLVTWARPLLTSREGLKQLVDPSLAGNFDFDDVAKVAAIASMCVHLEVTHRPFMGEVVQALKLIYNDTDEMEGDCCSQRESSATDSEFRRDFPPDASWWSTGEATPHLAYGRASSFMVMDYSSPPLEAAGNRSLWTSSLIDPRVSLPIRHDNRSGPLRPVRNRPAFFRFWGSLSDHGRFIQIGRAHV